jgi:hypothetical protein
VRIFNRVLFAKLVTAAHVLVLFGLLFLLEVHEVVVFVLGLCVLFLQYVDLAFVTLLEFLFLLLLLVDSIELLDFLLEFDHLGSPAVLCILISLIEYFSFRVPSPVRTSPSH